MPVSYEHYSLTHNPIWRFQAERTLTIFKNGHEESAKTNPELKFSDQNWGETSVCYTKSVKRLSKAKLKEIVHAACTYCAAGKGHTATQRGVKGKSVMEDKTDI